MYMYLKYTGYPAHTTNGGKGKGGLETLYIRTSGCKNCEPKNRAHLLPCYIYIFYVYECIYMPLLQKSPPNIGKWANERERERERETKSMRDR